MILYLMAVHGSPGLAVMRSAYQYQGPKRGDYCITITKQQQQLSVAENGEVGDKVLH